MNSKLSKKVGWKKPAILHWPTLEEVEKADDEQLLVWYRHLPCAENDAQQCIMSRIFDRFHNKSKIESFARGVYKDEVIKEDVKETDTSSK